MATRAQILFLNEDNEVLVKIYVHNDGYPESEHGLGTRLQKLLTQKVIEDSNGPDCLAASLVSLLKTESGNIYLCPANKIIGDYDAEYSYILKADEFGNNSVRLGIYSEESWMYIGKLEDADMERLQNDYSAIELEDLKKALDLA